MLIVLTKADRNPTIPTHTKQPLLNQRKFIFMNATKVSEESTIRNQTVKIDGNNLFYREAGNSGSPSILLLHGFPTSSHMFRNLIPKLASEYHVVAPDLPGFGFSDSPPRSEFKYTFENLVMIADASTEKTGLKRFAIYIFAYGAPVGLRLALAHPERIAA